MYVRNTIGLESGIGILKSIPSPSGAAPSGTALPNAVSVARTRDGYVDGLLSGKKWNTSNLTFGFPKSAGNYEYSGEAQRRFQSVNSAQEAAIRRAFTMFSSVANLTFTETSDGSARPTLRFANSDMPPTAWAYGPSGSPQGGDIWFNGSNGNYMSPVAGNYGYHTVLHEIGHALGLKHAHESEDGFATLPKSHQSMEYTVMSYSSYVGASTKAGYTNKPDSYAQTLMMDDIKAIQMLYGANFATNAGNTNYAWRPDSGQASINGVASDATAGNRIFSTIWDGGGNDTYDFSAYSTALQVNLAPGTWTTTSQSQLAELTYNGTKKAIGNIANAKLYNNDLRSLIENAVGGAGDDIIVGNQVGNRLLGGVGQDQLRGGMGDDVLIGGAGADVLDGGTGFDTVDYSGETAGVSLNARKGGTSGTALGDRFTGIERFIGSGYDDLIEGGNVAETIEGGRGRDTISGGTGNDRLFGGDGDDVLIGGSGRDELSGGAGADYFRFLSVSEIGKSAQTRDVVFDFSSEDRIDLSSIDANTRMVGQQKFVLLDGVGAKFTAPGQIRVRYETTSAGDRTLIEGNVDQSASADFQIEIRGRVAAGLSSYLQV